MGTNSFAPAFKLNVLALAFSLKVGLTEDEESAFSFSFSPFCSLEGVGVVAVVAGFVASFFSASDWFSFSFSFPSSSFFLSSFFSSSFFACVGVTASFAFSLGFSSSLSFSVGLVEGEETETGTGTEEEEGEEAGEVGGEVKELLVEGEGFPFIALFPLVGEGDAGVVEFCTLLAPGGTYFPPLL